MPRTPDSLTTYDLLHTPGIYAALSTDDGDVVLVAVRLVGITTAKDGSTSPCFHAYDHQLDEILFEPYELPDVIRDLLWPREVPAEVVAPVEPVYVEPVYVEPVYVEPVPTGSSDYDGPAF